MAETALPNGSDKSAEEPVPGLLARASQAAECTGLAVYGLALLLAPARSSDLVPAAFADWLYQPLAAGTLACTGLLLYWASLLPRRGRRTDSASLTRLVVLGLLVGLLLVLAVAHVSTDRALTLLDVHASNVLRDRMLVDSVERLPTPYTPAGAGGLWQATSALYDLRWWCYYFPVSASTYSAAYAQHAQALLGAGDVEGAALYARRLSRVDPGGVLTGVVEAKVLYQGGQVSAALASAKRAEAISRGSGGGTANAAVTRQVKAMVAYYAAAGESRHGHMDIARAKLVEYARLLPDLDVTWRVACDPAFSDFVRSDDYRLLEQEWPVSTSRETSSTTKSQGAGRISTCRGDS